MAVGEKLAMLVSFGFIGSVCWLVSQVQDPGVGAPAQVSVRASEQEAARRGTAGRTPDPRSNQGPTTATASLKYASAVETVDRTPRGPRVEVNLSESERPEDRAPITLPPLAVADRPTTTAVAEDENPPRQPPALAALLPTEGERVAGGPREQNQSSPEELTPRSEPEQQARTGAVTTVETRYVVQRGDALERVVAKLLGSTDRRLLRAVLAANPAIAKRSGRLIAGETLVIPAVDATTTAGAGSLAGGTSASQAKSLASPARTDPAPRSARAAPPAAESKRGRSSGGAKLAQASEKKAPPAGKRDAKSAKTATKSGPAATGAAVTRADKPNRNKATEPRRQEKRAKPRSPAT